MLYRNGPPRHGGFILFEAVLSIAVLALLFSYALPRWDDAVAEARLNEAAREVAAAVRRAQMEARSAASENGKALSGVHFVCEKEDDGRVHYWTVRAVQPIPPDGVLPRGIKALTQGLDLTIDQSGYLGNSRRYFMSLGTADGRFQRNITVALYTGRVRIT